MKAVISSTYDSNYLFFLPITTFLWNKLGVDVICFMPHGTGTSTGDRFSVVMKYAKILNAGLSINFFKAPEQKEATYAQCSRLYAAALDLPEDEILVTGDVDMGMFKLPVCYPVDGYFTIFGHDLVPEKQYPMCYLSASVKDWRKAFDINGRTYQQCLDDLVGVIECDHFRGNQWSLDQGEAFRKIAPAQSLWLEGRARPGTQFASNRVDRDDINWRYYVDDSLVDAHLWRPGFEENNFSNIMELLKMKYPYDNFDWLIKYRNEYIKLL